MSPDTWHVTLTPTATAIDSSPASYPTMDCRLVHQDRTNPPPPKKKFTTQKINRMFQNMGRNGTSHGLFRQLKTTMKIISQSVSQSVSFSFYSYYKAQEVWYSGSFHIFFILDHFSTFKFWTIPGPEVDKKILKCEYCYFQKSG